jgi:hypothetical protein
MRPPRRIVGTGILACGALVLLLAAVVTWFKHRAEVQTLSDEQKLARSLGIIRTSTPTDRKVLKVLFYGQSITLSGWHNEVVDHWREKYPNTVFVVQNRALGGFASQYLERTTQQDIAAFYPDLIVFHVYGDHHAYERIIRMFRSQTAADILVQSDHGRVVPDPPCDEGLHFTLHDPPGCKGFFWLTQSEWEDEMSYHKEPAFANTYAFALEPQRAWWRDYLLTTRIDPNSLLLDGLHPNADGKHLIARFFNQYFDNLVEHWNGETENHVVSYLGDGNGHSKPDETIDFDGTRLELLANKPLTVWPTVTVDGGSPKDLDGCYQVSRATSIGTVPNWPAIRRITLHRDHVPEEWTAILQSISPDQKSFDFSVRGSVSGDQGTGNSAENYTARSGLLDIEAQDWMVLRAFDEKHIPLHAPFTVHWSVDYVCGNTPEVIDLGGGHTQYRYILATGLANAAHTVKLSSPPDSLVSVTEFRAYQPPLHSH